MDSLGKKLQNIEVALGGEAGTPTKTDDALGWHLDYIESLIEQGSGGTKLYSHLIKWVSNNIEVMKIITTSGEPFQNITEIGNLINKNKYVRLSTPGAFSTMYIGENTSYVNLRQCTFNPNNDSCIYKEYNVSRNGEITDTVTEF